ncbi:serine/arginine repetitive matrix protein 1-like isoform X2 [Ananas comosus]|nr:serine/arginine repetitive matrix protein 1-like isoform X2 [Ananas comosus]XP_020095629.1 serine/arginine repetitive matrix protein 1-like isoform X2 [Ananas comosus]
MAEKVSTLILKVDLECCRCNRRIKKVLCKLQERENIKSIVYDAEEQHRQSFRHFQSPVPVEEAAPARPARPACDQDIQIQEDKPPPKPAPEPPSPNAARPSPHRSRPSPNRHRRPSLRQSRPSRNRRPRPSPHRNRPSPHRNRPSPHRSRPSQHRNRPSPHRSRPSPNRRQRRRWRCRILIRCGRSAAGSRAPARATTTEEEEEAAGAAPAAGRTADGTPRRATATVVAVLPGATASATRLSARKNLSTPAPSCDSTTYMSTYFPSLFYIIIIRMF